MHFSQLLCSSTLLTYHQPLSNMVSNETFATRQLRSQVSHSFYHVCMNHGLWAHHIAFHLGQ